MLIKGNLDNLEIEEIRVFRYALLADELGAMPNYQKYDGWKCEEVLKIEQIDNKEIIEHGWEIIGTNKIIERQWTTPK